MPINPSQPDKISSQHVPSGLYTGKKFDGVLTSKDGREYIVKSKTIQHGRGWKVWQGIKALSGTVCTLGIGLAFEGLRNKWKEAWTGEERVVTWIQFLSYPPATSDKASSVAVPVIKHGQVINEKSTQFEPIRELLNSAKKSISDIPLDELKIGLHEILTLQPSLETSEYKTTVLIIAEWVAQSYLDEGKGQKAIEIRMKAAQYIPPGGALANIPQKVASADPKYGQMLYPIDTNLFKNQALHMQFRHIQNDSIWGPSAKQLHFEGQLTHHARTNLQKTLDFAKGNKVEFLQRLPSMYCSGIFFTSNVLTYPSKNSEGIFNKYKLPGYYSSEHDQITTIHFVGVGRVTIGAQDNFKSHYNNITIDLDPTIPTKEASAKLHILLSALGLGTASASPRDVDEERIKIMKLFRAFYPSQAYSFERDEKTFTESLESLKKRISDDVPEMKLKFKEYLEDHPEKMYKQEVTPGQFIWAVKGLAEEVKKEGGIGLLESVEGADFSKALRNLATICSDGSMSIQDRYQRGIIDFTENPINKFYNGSANSVTTKLITENMSKNPSLYLSKGEIKILYNLELVERVGYVSDSIKEGSKALKAYQNRPSILELSKQCQINPDTPQSIGNEVHIQNRIPPQFIKSILVANKNEKQAVVKALKEKGLLSIDKEGNELIFGKPVNEVVLVGQFTPPKPEPEIIMKGGSIQAIQEKDLKEKSAAFITIPKSDLDALNDLLSMSFSQPILKKGSIEAIQEKNLTEESEAFAPIRQFIVDATKDLQSIPIPQLRSGLLSILKLKPVIQTPEYRTTLLTIAERVAQDYSNKNAKKVALEIRLEAAQAFAPSPPLSTLKTSLQKEDPRLGLIIHPIDTSVFKNQSLAVQRQLFEGEAKPRLHIEGKVSHYVRENMKHTIDFAKAQPKEFLKGLPDGFCTDFTVSSEDAVYCGRKPDGKFSSDIPTDGFNISKNLYNSSQSIQLTTLHFHGVGKVKIGESTALRSHYNNISIDLDPGISEEEAAAKLTIIFASLGIGATASSPRPIDEERIKIMRLFRAFYPSEASKFEQGEEAFIESIDSLQKRIEAKVPDMKLKFKEYLVDHPDRMYQQEVFPGQYIWAVKGLAQEVRNAGGMGLMSSIGGDTAADSFKRFVLICKSGAMSTQERYQRGIIVAGASPVSDLQKGGADSVYTRLITTKMDKDPINHTLSGNMNILYDLDLVERVGYAYHGDKYGTKEPYEYHTRPSIVELTKLCEKYPYATNSKDNEVCIHSYVPPRYIKGALVRTNKDKQNLVTLLRKEGLLVMDEDGVERIFGKTVDQFIHVGKYNASYWA